MSIYTEVNTSFPVINSRIALIANPSIPDTYNGLTALIPYSCELFCLLINSCFGILTDNRTTTTLLFSQD